MAKTFEMSFDLGNAAFDGTERPLEIASILRGLADKIDQGAANGSVFDSNGNNVGSWGFDEAEEEDEGEPACCSDMDINADGECENCGAVAE